MQVVRRVSEGCRRRLLPWFHEENDPDVGCCARVLEKETSPGRRLRGRQVILLLARADARRIERADVLYAAVGKDQFEGNHPAGDGALALRRAVCRVRLARAFKRHAHERDRRVEHTVSKLCESHVIRYVKTAIPSIVDCDFGASRLRGGSCSGHRPYCGRRPCWRLDSDIQARRDQNPRYDYR